MSDHQAGLNNSPDVIGRLKVLVQIAQANVESHHSSYYGNPSIPNFSMQTKIPKSKSTNKKRKKRSKSVKNQEGSETPYFTMFQPQYSLKQEPIKAKRFNTRIDPLVKIEAQTTYHSKSPKNRYNSTLFSTPANYPRKFNSPSHSSFSRQHRFNQESSFQSITESFSRNKRPHNSRKSNSSLGKSQIVSISYKNKNPNIPYSRYSQLSLSKLD